MNFRLKWGLKGNYRDKIKKRLGAGSTSDRPFKLPNFKTSFIPRTSPYNKYPVKDTLSFELEALGDSQTDEANYTIPADGHIYKLQIDFPVGSEYSFYVELFVNNGFVFPANPDQRISGDGNIKQYDVFIPLQKGDILKAKLTNKTGINPAKSYICWVEPFIQYMK